MSNPRFFIFHNLIFSSNKGPFFFLYIMFLFSENGIFAQQFKIDTQKLQQQIRSAAAAVEKQKNAKRNFTLEEIWKENKFKAETVDGLISMKDGIHYTSLESNGTENFIVKYSYKTGKATDTLVKQNELIPEGKENPIEIESYQFSADETRVLISSETESIYRHSTRELYFVYDFKTEKLSPLTETKVRLAEFSPEGNKVAFVNENNLFVKDLISGTETAVTKDGKWNETINGATDWVYEEEFSFDKAFFWSPDGKKIAFYRFDESRVKEFSLEKYGSLYPAQYRYKYPKAGEENAKVSIRIFDIETLKSIPVEGAQTTAGLAGGTEETEYIPRIKWTQDPGLLSVQKMNRHQNKLDLLLADASTGKTKTILSETSLTYIGISNDLTFFDDKKHFIWTSEKSGFNHIYLYETNGKLIRQITNGNWDVSDFKGVDEKNQTLFYISSEESPIVRKLYSIKIDGTGKKTLTGKNGFNEASFSGQFQYYINYFSDAYTPYQITLNDASGKEIRVIKDNRTLKDTLGLYTITIKEFFKFTPKSAEGAKTSESYSLNGWMIKPANFDSSKKYPVLMYVYGGPGIQTVENKWGGGNELWYQYLSQKGYIIVSVDNRGTGARGAEFKKCTYKELGKLETIDQVEAAKFLGSLSFVDKSRIGIQGWSYGGYLSSLCITKGNSIKEGVFKMAIAVAPVTNWRFYDSIYTERYMQTPQENPNGYDDNSPINHVDELKGKYLLVHGTADDNVHFQNSVEMVNALVNANKQFDLFYYPDKNHGIYGGNTRLHLYTKMTNFILENL